jgi:tRNA G10  N-methylase Trm11
VGTDVDEAALRRARANLDSIGATNATVERGDARRHDPGTIDLVITNPPMGRRVLPGFDLDELLASVMENALHRLEPHGRLVLLSPRPRTTRAVAAAHGWECTRRARVDLGGFEVELERFDRRTGL